MKLYTHKFKAARAHKAYAGIVMDLLEQINTARSLALAISFRYAEYRSVDLSLLELKPDAIDPIVYMKDSQAVALFKKSTYLESGHNLAEEAKKNFFKVEKELQAFNKSKKDNPFYVSTIYTASRIMRNLLGPVPEMSELKTSFTPGATYSKRAGDATLAAKLSDCLDVTPHAKPYLLSWLGSDPAIFNAYRDLKIIEVPGGKFATVQKDFRKDRAMDVQPLGNMLLQRGLGLHIKSRLPRVGIYISTGQSDHKALLEFDQDAWATIDQSDASNRISWSLVKDLLPLDWYLLLNSVRTKRTLVDGVWHDLELFMSQGNGFTFELQTAIFYCLIQAMHINAHGKKTVVSVYGDDVIVPVHHGKLVVDSLDIFGLKVNTEKSYISGPFKESCGFDTLSGRSVRPIYLKEFEQHETIYYVQLCNFIKRVYDYLSFGNHYNLSECRAWKRSLSHINSDSRLFGPPSLGDNTIVTLSKPDNYRHAYWRHGILYVTCYKRSYRRGDFVQPRRKGGSELAYALLGGSSAGTLKRGASWTLRTARACPVNWA